jgi:hypothetical protein
VGNILCPTRMDEKRTLKGKTQEKLLTAQKTAIRA